MTKIYHMDIIRISYEKDILHKLTDDTYLTEASAGLVVKACVSGS